MTGGSSTVLRSNDAAAMKSRRPSGVMVRADPRWNSANKGLVGDEGEGWRSTSSTSDANFSWAGDRFPVSRLRCWAFCFLRRNRRNIASSASRNARDTPTATPATRPFEVDDLDWPLDTEAVVAAEERAWDVRVDVEPAMFELVVVTGPTEEGVVDADELDCTAEELVVDVGAGG